MIAAVYARKSTGQDVADDAKSVTRQIDNAKAFAAQHGWVVEDQYVFVDDGISGAETKRLAGKQRLLDLIRAGAPFDVLVMQSQDRFSRRDGDEAFAELKSVARRGVDIWFYADRQPFRFGSLATNVVGLLQGEFAAEFRRAIATKTYEAMERKAKAGHVTGGKVFGFENVRVDGHVERRIIDAEAAVIREIFHRSASGEGLRSIAKTLNAAGSPTPRSQQGRPRGWAPSSIREVLHRSVYRGLVTWNRTKKRDLDGHQRQHDRPQGEWLTIPAEHLRIVDDDMWRAVHDRLRDVHAGASAAPPLLAGRGIRQRYFLTGFARCVRCGGSMQAVSRSSGPSRSFRYVCATYWNRGSTICGNGLMAAMPETDRAVRDFLQAEVLQSRIIERALDSAIVTLQQRSAGRGSRAEIIRAQLSQLDRELANLTETAARDGAIPAVLDALRRRDEDRRRLTAELAGIDQHSTPVPAKATDVRARLRRFLDDWNGLLAEDSAGARRVLDIALTDRIRFKPDSAGRRYELTIPVAFNRLIVAVVPALREGLQEMMASPPGSGSA